MDLREKEVKRYAALALILVLIVIGFFIIKPIILSILAGLLLAYIFYPIYKYLLKYLRERTITAFAVSLIVVLILFIPLWFLLPVIIRQTFETFSFFQTLDVAKFVKELFSSLSPQMQVDITTAIISFIGKISTATLTGLSSLLLNLPDVLLHATVVIFSFFFAMRDGAKLKAYMAELSPLKKEKTTLLANQFKQITNSLIYGNFIIGIVQGLLTGVGLLIFGVPQALLLTLIAMVASIIPMLGPWLVWIPAAVYLFSAGYTGAGVGFALYSLLIVSTVDNVMRPYLISRGTKSSSGIILIGMIGGLITFGVLGLLIGPLVLEYLVLFLDAYKNRTFADMFDS